MKLGGSNLQASEIISDFSKMVNLKDIIITEYGYISNLLHKISDRERTIYMLDENIDPIALGLGISCSRNEKTFILISEETFRSKITSIINLGKNYPRNLIIIVFNFEKYEQFLQKQVFSRVLSTELNKITRALGMRSYNITKIKEFKAVLKKIYGDPEPVIIELMINRVNINESLHQIEFKDIRERFMNSLK